MLKSLVVFPVSNKQKRTYLMDPNGVWEASEKTFVFIVGLHEEVEVFFGLKNSKKTRKDKWVKEKVILQ